jgi:hypothetical protein
MRCSPLGPLVSPPGPHRLLHEGRGHRGDIDRPSIVLWRIGSRLSRLSRDVPGHPAFGSAFANRHSHHASNPPWRAQPTEVLVKLSRSARRSATDAATLGNLVPGRMNLRKFHMYDWAGEIPRRHSSLDPRDSRFLNQARHGFASSVSGAAPGGNPTKVATRTSSPFPTLDALCT